MSSSQSKDLAQHLDFILPQCLQHASTSVKEFLGCFRFTKAIPDQAPSDCGQIYLSVPCRITLSKKKIHTAPGVFLVLSLQLTYPDYLYSLFFMGWEFISTSKC